MINPWFLAAVFVTLCIFYYFNQKNKIRRQKRQDLLEHKREELIEMLRKKEDDKK